MTFNALALVMEEREQTEHQFSKLGNHQNISHHLFAAYSNAGN